MSQNQIISAKYFFTVKVLRILNNFSLFWIKGLQRQRLIGSPVAEFNHARTITNDSAKGLDARQDDYNKGICSPGSLANNSVR